MSEPKTIMEKDRPIIFLSTTGAGGNHWCVGRDGVTKLIHSVTPICHLLKYGFLFTKVTVS